MSREENQKQKLGPEAVEFLENQNLCVLCNTQLEIRVESYLEDYLLREEAICPHCKIKTRDKNHRMH